MPDEEEYFAKLDQLVSALVASGDVSGFCSTQLADTEQETNGLLFEDRRPKLNIDKICAIFAQL